MLTVMLVCHRACTVKTLTSSSKAAAFKFDSSGSSVTVSGDGLSVTSSGSGYAKSPSPISSGVHRWWILVEKDTMSDESTCCRPRQGCGILILVRMVE